MLTIGQVAKKYSISRSTLIYYDSIGILKPNTRTDSNYRLYSKEDLLRMDQIALYRNAGLSMNAISEIINQDNGVLHSALELRLQSINSEIQDLRNQQKVILNILKNKKHNANTRVITRGTWVSLLESAGLDNDGMKKWHIAFESTSPEAHQDFLESIGIEKNEIKSIRQWARV